MASGSQNPQHLAKPSKPIAKEHQAKLTDDGVERGIRVGECFCCSLLPGDSWIPLARHSQHPRIRIQPDDRTPRPHAGCNFAGQDTSTAGNVQYTLPWQQLGGSSDKWSPLLEERRNEELVVGSCGGEEGFEVWIRHTASCLRNLHQSDFLALGLPNYFPT